MRARLLLLMAAVIGTLSVGFGLTAQARIDNDPDCDTVAIIKCGVFSESKLRDKYNNDGLYKDQDTVYAAFGISKSDLNGSFESGVVHRDGTVTIGSKVVATGAMTAGRWYNPTKDMTKISGTTRAYKMSTSHFADEGQTAFIKMVNGEFKFAVMKSCGNPVSAKPKAQPAAACKALTIAALSRTKFSFNGSATTENGATIKSYTYVVKKGSTTVQTHTINSTSKSSTYEYNQETPGAYTVNLTVNTSLGNKTASACNASFTVKEITPVYACTKLTIAKLTDTSWKFTTTHTATNATLTKTEYVVTKAGAEVSRSTNDTYSQTAPGTYTVQAYLTFTVSGTSKTVTADACKGTFTVNEKPKVPVYTCDKLTITKLTDTSWKFATAYSLENATLKSIVYVVTDKDGKELSRSTTDNYTQAVAGTYTVQSFVTVTVNGADKTVTSEACKATVTVNKEIEYCTVPGKEYLPKDSPLCKEEMCAVPGKENLPKDSPLCKENEMCAVPGKENLPKNSPDCKEEKCTVKGKENLPKDSDLCVETPAELPKTGPTENAMAILGLGALVVSTGYYINSRRALSN